MSQVHLALWNITFDQTNPFQHVFFAAEIQHLESHKYFLWCFREEKVLLAGSVCSLRRYLSAFHQGNLNEGWATGIEKSKWTPLPIFICCSKTPLSRCSNQPEKAVLLSCKKDPAKQHLKTLAAFEAFLWFVWFIKWFRWEEQQTKRNVFFCRGKEHFHPELIYSFLSLVCLRPKDHNGRTQNCMGDSLAADNWCMTIAMSTTYIALGFLPRDMQFIAARERVETALKQHSGSCNSRVCFLANDTGSLSSIPNATALLPLGIHTFLKFYIWRFFLSHQICSTFFSVCVSQFRKDTVEWYVSFPILARQEENIKPLWRTFSIYFRFRHLYLDRNLRKVK